MGSRIPKYHAYFYPDCVVILALRTRETVTSLLLLEFFIQVVVCEDNIMEKVGQVEFITIIFLFQHVVVV